MEDKILGIINTIRMNKNLPVIVEMSNETSLRNDLGFSSLDLAELTVRIEDEFDVDIFEDGLVTTVGEIYKKLSM